MQMYIFVSWTQLLKDWQQQQTDSFMQKAHNSIT